MAWRPSRSALASGGLLPPDDLAIGEGLLLSLGLAVVQHGLLIRTPNLDRILDGDQLSASTCVLLASLEAATGQTPTPDRIRDRLGELGASDEQIEDTVSAALSKFDATRRVLVGDIGEEIVLAEARSEPLNAGHADLATAVQRVSLKSDTYGYDISAPRLHGPGRLLEVKATTRSTLDDSFVFFISRHEAEVGATRTNWMLVLCLIEDVESRTGDVAGWLPFEKVVPHLPSNNESGRWESASIQLSLDEVTPGLPSAFV